MAVGTAVLCVVSGVLACVELLLWQIPTYCVLLLPLLLLLLLLL
jgi:hypothetical protein